MDGRSLSAQFALISAAIASLLGAGCSTLPDPKFSKHEFPRADAFLDVPARKHENVGTVRAKAEFTSLDPTREEDMLCRNYFNKATRDLIRLAREQGADAVKEVRSVVFYADGTHELFAKPECADDGAEGQILVVGMAIRWADEAALKARTAAPPAAKRRVKAPAELTAVAPPSAADLHDAAEAAAEEEGPEPAPRSTRSPRAPPLSPEVLRGRIHPGASPR